MNMWTLLLNVASLLNFYMLSVESTLENYTKYSAACTTTMCSKGCQTLVKRLVIPGNDLPPNCPFHACTT